MELEKENKKKEWFVVNTVSGHEYKVKEKLEMRIETMGLQDRIFRVIVPEQKEIEYKGTLDNSKQITFAQAKALALAKVSGANDNHIKIKEDYEDGRKVYEGKIIYNGYEYEFEIDANSGIFLEWEVERLH